jgi:hypothetical protein
MYTPWTQKNEACQKSINKEKCGVANGSHNIFAQMSFRVAWMILKVEPFPAGLINYIFNQWYYCKEF